MLVKRSLKRHGKRSIMSRTWECGLKRSVAGPLEDFQHTDLESARVSRGCPENVRHQMRMLKESYAKHCLRRSSFERCTTMLGNSSLVAPCTFVVHPASSTTRKESLTSADTTSTTSLASRPRITQRSGVDERVSRYDLVWRSYERPSMAWLEES